jgi:hypothetical protein
VGLKREFAAYLRCGILATVRSILAVSTGAHHPRRLPLHGTQFPPVARATGGQACVTCLGGVSRALRCGEGPPARNAIESVAR